jgi:DnaK suppressor protein
MTVKQREEILTLLKLKRAGLLASLSPAKRAERIDVERLADPLDRATQAANREQGAGEINRETKLLEKVNYAIHRLLLEDIDVELATPYGICTNCEEEIPMNRLRIVPESEYCRECQEVREGYHS